MNTLFKDNAFDVVCHLAVQAGVRYSLTHPEVYIRSNIEGFWDNNNSETTR
jgi:UDP-glucuronate 4-epimerase